ncbi:hypothetical protein FOPE_01067 [Fonsecaea pedrosoi]|nr:hypothetical protein FOPE_01067 [Fonsecaea pedrosoi]
MGQPSQQASNAIIYTTYAAFLCANSSFKGPFADVFGLVVAWTLRHQTKGEYLATLRTQKGTKHDSIRPNFEYSALEEKRSG